MKLTILIDLDGITADTSPAWLDRIYETTGVRATGADIKHWEMTDNPVFKGLSPEQIFGVLNEPGFTLGLKPMPGAVENIKNLYYAGHEIYFVTARFGSNTMPETIKWVKQHFPFLRTDKYLCFHHDKYMVRGDVFIDDKPESLELYAKHNPDAHLVTINYPFNQLQLERLFRVPYNENAWNLIHEHINLLAKVADEHVS